MFLFKIYLAEDINIAIKDYIKYFNTQRLAYSLKYKTPVQFYTERGFN
ncbi:MAG: IS3 family transposase [Bacilli bacterium]|nr:IS3 family transposase [Bacilli bacterium]